MLGKVAAVQVSATNGLGSCYALHGVQIRAGGAHGLLRLAGEIEHIGDLDLRALVIVAPDGVQRGQARLAGAGQGAACIAVCDGGEGCGSAV